MSFVSIASLGEKFGVPVPTFRAFIHLASLPHQTDYWAEGRTVEHLGIAHLTADQFHAFVMERGAYRSPRLFWAFKGNERLRFCFERIISPLSIMLKWWQG